ncbi:prepilin peptidase [Virgibacillus sp. NKC19-3]|uniref:prepilin peptidase n=1 Tax=Virgibacillus saliphilus TaxID=2831674 RepID=UPI001C9A4972|nr:A24 family peptidase [Virgibacillus sp. NKC19-3]MBY7143863.1 prepilin peptidase [Virgibacillus sp. NKC19-3]
MDIFFIVLFFLFGLIFGSFFNVLGLRIPKNQTFIMDRSICPGCRHILSWYELIPVISYVIQLGKCRHCRGEITPIYPIMEITTGFLFMYSYMMIGLQLELITALLLVSMLIIILVSDIKYMLIPNKILLFFLPLIILMRIIQPLDPWWSALAGGLLGFIIIALIILVSRGGMGAGDMKLFGLLGIILGIEKVLLAFFLSCIIGAVIGVILLLFKIIDRKQQVPFGPYIVVAAFLTYFHGDSLLNWYFTFF